MTSGKSHPSGKSGKPPREPAEGSREVIENELARDDRKEREGKIDKAVDMSFPASDPAASGYATATEPPARPAGRQAPLVTREQIERASGGSLRDPPDKGPTDASIESVPRKLAPGDDAAPGTPGTGEDTCPRCRGTGTVDGDVCPNCDGSGRVIKGIGGA